MPTPFSSNDLGRILDARNLTRGRSLGHSGGVAVELEGEAIIAIVQDGGPTYDVRIVPFMRGRRVGFERHCTCLSDHCPHIAAAALTALDRFPILRKPEQQTFFDALMATPATREAWRMVFELAPAEPPHACAVRTSMIGERTGIVAATTPGEICADQQAEPKLRDLAYLLGAGGQARSWITANLVVQVLKALVESGHGRWHVGGKRLVQGSVRVLQSASHEILPPRSGVIMADSGPWYVDASTGAVGRIRVQAQDRPSRPALGAPDDIAGRVDRFKRAPEPITYSEHVIVERQMTPVLRLTQLTCPDEFSRMQTLDAILVEFDYAGGRIAVDEDRQFVRVRTQQGAVFVRRDQAAESAVLDTLKQDGLAQVRVAIGQAAKDRLVLAFRGRNCAEAWEFFIAERLPTLRALGWRIEIDPDFGPRVVENAGLCDMRVADGPQGSFSLDFGIEIDGIRQPLLPILLRLRERGGMESAKVIGGEVVTSLEDGRILKLPAERIARLLAIINDLIEDAGRCSGERLVLDETAAHRVLDLEDLVAARWQDGAAIASKIARFRNVDEVPHAPVPSSFTASLRPYQQLGVNWLQHLRKNRLGGLLADDMGLGKTAQTIAHIAIEHEAGRLKQPVLVVVPTSLVPNWTSELAGFAPHLRVLVLHGQDRHKRRADLSDKHVVITTYTVLSRDIDEMVGVTWHMVVLDEAQAIKSPTAKVTQVVCQLDTPHRLCLSGTPIENNLDELWSQFAFLMPGLLGQRKSFNRRFRTPIERSGDVVRRGQLAARIRPFILRRSKASVASELPPKHTILRRITLAPDQRDLYETIRATMHQKVTEGIAARGMAQSHMLVLHALLKLRQVCCDPRLVRVSSSRLSGTSSKLDDLMGMVSEMVAEGRRILLFSQFTTMLDLIKPALATAGIGFAELRGDTTNRAEPVRRFEGGEVPLFLISLKAGAAV